MDLIDDNIPRLHDISAIFGKRSIKLKEQIKTGYLSLFDSPSTFYLRSRYPDYAKDLILQATEASSRNILETTKEVWQWLLTMKPSIK
jgi:HEPN domain-containing protein